RAVESVGAIGTCPDLPFPATISNLGFRAWRRAFALHGTDATKFQLEGSATASRARPRVAQRRMLLPVSREDGEAMQVDCNSRMSARIARRVSKDLRTPMHIGRGKATT